MLIPYVHGRHLISQESKALHCLEYARRRTWGLTAATALQRRARSTGQGRKLESICCCRAVCRCMGCKPPRRNLALILKSLPPLV